MTEAPLTRLPIVVVPVVDGDLVAVDPAFVAVDVVRGGRGEE